MLAHQGYQLQEAFPSSEKEFKLENVGLPGLCRLDRSETLGCLGTPGNRLRVSACGNVTTPPVPVWISAIIRPLAREVQVGFCLGAEWPMYASVVDLAQGMPEHGAVLQT